MEQLNFSIHEIKSGEILDCGVNTEEREERTAESIKGSLQHLEGLEFDILGSWLWISGDTKEHKEELKKCGCWYAPQRKKWYWKPSGSKSRKFKGSFEELKQWHGSKEKEENKIL